jgi:histidyl-tRNA synthetase
MTPTVARMVAARRRELVFPLRWFSIPNVFRYERPQKGRLREHWQLNADLFGVEGVEAEAEIIALAHRIMTDLGAHEHDFEIRVNDRTILSSILEELNVDDVTERKVVRLLDAKDKMPDFDEKIEALLGHEKGALFLQKLASVSSTASLEKLQMMLNLMGVHNIVIDTSIVRGFDYYTGIVFEVYDTSPDNNRSLFGGGRYDRLLELFGDETVPAVGFGMGDVTARDFLETHNLLPKYMPATELMLLPMEPEAVMHAMQLAQNLRGEDVTVSVNLSGKKVGDMIKQADKLGIPTIITIGSRERESGEYTLKQLGSGKETTMPANRIAEHLFSHAG